MLKRRGTFSGNGIDTPKVGSYNCSKGIQQKANTMSPNSAYSVKNFDVTLDGALELRNPIFLKSIPPASVTGTFRKIIYSFDNNDAHNLYVTSNGFFDMQGTKMSLYIEDRFGRIILLQEESAPATEYRYRLVDSGEDIDYVTFSTVNVISRIQICEPVVVGTVATWKYRFVRYFSDNGVLKLKVQNPYIPYASSDTSTFPFDYYNDTFQAMRDEYSAATLEVSAIIPYVCVSNEGSTPLATVEDFLRNPSKTDPNKSAFRMITSAVPGLSIWLKAFFKIKQSSTETYWCTWEYTEDNSKSWKTCPEFINKFKLGTGSALRTITVSDITSGTVDTETNTSLRDILAIPMPCYSDDDLIVNRPDILNVAADNVTRRFRLLVLERPTDSVEIASYVYKNTLTGVTSDTFTDTNSDTALRKTNAERLYDKNYIFDVASTRYKTSDTPKLGLLCQVIFHHTLTGHEYSRHLFAPIEGTTDVLSNASINNFHMSISEAVEAYMASVYYGNESDSTIEDEIMDSSSARVIPYAITMIFPNFMKGCYFPAGNVIASDHTAPLQENWIDVWDYDYVDSASKSTTNVTKKPLMLSQPAYVNSAENKHLMFTMKGLILEDTSGSKLTYQTFSSLAVASIKTVATGSVDTIQSNQANAFRGAHPLTAAATPFFIGEDYKIYNKRKDNKIYIPEIACNLIKRFNIESAATELAVAHSTFSWDTSALQAAKLGELMNSPIHESFNLVKVTATVAEPSVFTFNSNFYADNYLAAEYLIHAVNAEDAYVIDADPEHVFTFRVYAPTLTMKTMMTDLQTEDTSSLDTQYQEEHYLNEVSHLDSAMVLDSDAELFENEIGSPASAKNLLEYKKSIYAWSGDNTENNVLVSNADALQFPVTNLLDVPTQGLEKIVSVLPWRDYLLIATENAVYLTNKTDDGFLTKIVNTFVGVPYKDRRTFVSILNGTILKSGNKIFSLTPNPSASDDSILYLSELSSQISDLIDATLPFSWGYTTETYYGLFLSDPAATTKKTYLFKYYYTSKVWSLLEFPIALAQVKVRAVQDIILTDVSGKEYYLDKEMSSLFDTLDYGDVLETPLETLATTDLEDIIVTPIPFAIDSGEKAPDLFYSKGFIESKFTFSTLSNSQKFFPIAVDIYVDGTKRILHTAIETDSSLWADGATSLGILNTDYAWEDDAMKHTLKHLILRHSAKGKSIRHVLSGTSKSKFRFYTTFYKFRNSPGQR